MRNLPFPWMCSVRVSAFFFAFWLSIHSFSFAAEVTLVKPVHQTPVELLLEEPEKVYESRRGYIDLNVQPLLPALEIAEADILELSFFSDAHYRVVVQSISREKNGVVSISGAMEGQQFGPFVLTLVKEGFLITLHDIERARLYQSSGGPPGNPSLVTELYIKQIPPTRDLPPLIPPKNELAISVS
jgi:hypothetical protein